MSFLPVMTNLTTTQLNSTGFTWQFPGSEYAVRCRYYITVSNISSLAAGAIVAQELQQISGTWAATIQQVSVIASGGGTPGVVNGNTASATAVVGGVATNNTGITAITSTATIIIEVAGTGRPQRLSFTASSGTADVTIEACGLLET